MKKVIIPNPKHFDIKKKKILYQGKEKFHVISDFDRTLTKAFVNGEETPSVISELRKRNYINEEYSQKANQLAEKYHAIEIDPNVPLEEKNIAMHEWWTKHFNLLIKSGLRKNHIKQVVDSGKIQFRQGALEFLDLLYEKKIPLVIMSSSGLGGDSIRMMLEREGRLYNNIHIISNVFEWDQEGNVICVKEPIIHVMNKAEVSIKGLPIYNELLKRKNVLLLGDGIGDLGMIEGFEYDNLIKIGFLNYGVEENLEDFKKAFDVLIVGDGSFEFVNNFLQNF